uniref:hypothetical protein n=1 Tax=Polaromonas sp. H6N TaxID=1840293 RepID=UPI0015E82817|nr:hypothetical protein [Polaromonas sp. H6N]
MSKQLQGHSNILCENIVELFLDLSELDTKRSNGCVVGDVFKVCVVAARELKNSANFTCCIHVSFFFTGVRSAVLGKKRQPQSASSQEALAGSKVLSH